MGTEYKRAGSDVMETFDRVLKRHDRFKDLLSYEVRIEILLAWSGSGAPVKVHGVPALASIKIVGGEERSTDGPDLRIKVDGARYGLLAPKVREAIFAHELYHIELVREEDGSVRIDVYDRPVIKLIPDDWCINGFKEVVEWYNDDSVELLTYRKVGAILGQGTLPFEPVPEPVEHEAKPSCEMGVTTVEIPRRVFDKLRDAGVKSRKKLEIKEIVSDLADSTATYLVFKGASTKPQYAIRAHAMVDAIRMAKARAAKAYQPRVAIDEHNKTQTLGLEALYAPPIAEQARKEG